jgi:hypothetical protein
MKRHTTDMVSLVFGIAFVGIAAWWLVSLYLDLSVPHLGWFAAGGLILFGLFGVIASLRGGEDTSITSEPAPPAPADVEPEPAHTSPPAP